MSGLLVEPVDVADVGTLLFGEGLELGAIHVRTPDDHDGLVPGLAVVPVPEGGER